MGEDDNRHEPRRTIKCKDFPPWGESASQEPGCITRSVSNSDPLGDSPHAPSCGPIRAQRAPRQSGLEKEVKAITQAGSLSMQHGVPAHPTHSHYTATSSAAESSQVAQAAVT